MKRAFLIEDDITTARLISRILEAEGYAVEWDYELGRGLDAHGRGDFDLLISDLNLTDTGDDDTSDTYYRLKAAGADIIMSGHKSSFDDVLKKDGALAENIKELIK